MANIDEIEKAGRVSDERYDIDYTGIIYTATYSAISSVSGGAALNVAGVVASSGMPLAITLVFVTQLLPKLAKELDNRHKINQIKEDAYMSGRLESRKGTTKNLLFSGVSALGRASAY